MAITETTFYTPDGIQIDLNKKDISIGGGDFKTIRITYDDVLGFSHGSIIRNKNDNRKYFVNCELRSFNIRLEFDLEESEAQKLYKTLNNNKYNR